MEKELIILKGYIKTPMIFKNTDGTEEREEGGWITDPECGHLFAIGFKDETFDAIPEGDPQLLYKTVMKWFNK
jgi:hypothetical protein